jgi:phage tail-like protein
MAVGDRKKDPYLSFRFLVEIQEEIREGGVNDYVHKLPKITKYPNITLKRGLTDSDVLWKWHQDVVNGKFKQTTVRVILMDSEGNGRVGDMK